MKKAMDLGGHPAVLRSQMKDDHVGATTEGVYHSTM